MSRREQVHSPYDLTGGERVEVESKTELVVIDLLYRHRLEWFGTVAATTAGAFTLGGQVVVLGHLVGIAPAAYLTGSVFIRRRAGQDHQRTRSREVSGG